MTRNMLRYHTDLLYQIDMRIYLAHIQTQTRPCGHNLAK